VIGSRLSHKATDDLPANGWEIMYRGFETKKRYSVIAAELAAVGFKVPERTIARRAGEWRKERSRQELLADLARVGVALPGWDFEELLGLMTNIDLSPGCILRTRNRVQAAVSKVLTEPSRDSIHSLARELVRFQLQTLAFRRRGAGGP
jgi:hypothetical protein